MTTDEAIEVLGGLVAQAGGEGDDALDTIKGALAEPEVLIASEVLNALPEAARGLPCVERLRLKQTYSGLTLTGWRGGKLALLVTDGIAATIYRYDAGGHRVRS